jgi:hypothetical protein
MIDPLYNNRQSQQFQRWEQDIYWGNIQGISQPYNLKHWRGQFGGSRYPYIIFTGTNHLPLHKLVLNKDAIDYLNTKQLHICCFELLHLRLLNQEHNRGWFTEFKSNTPYDLIRADELDSIDEFVKKYNLTNVVVRVGNYNVAKVLQKTYPSMILDDDHMFINTFRRLIDITVIPKPKLIKKTFMCPNNRYAFHRHLIMTQLVKFDGNYSWQYSVDNKFIDEIEWIEPNNLDSNFYDQILPNNEILNNDHFYIDHKFEKIHIFQNFTHYYKTSPLLSNTAGTFKSIGQLHQESFVSVINEHRYAQPLGVSSEKNLAAIINESPFIMVAPPFTLKYIREKMNIKTFSDYWDESYDEEENHTIRLNKIFKVVEYIGNLSLSEQQKMYESMRDLLRKNREQMISFIQLDYIRLLSNKYERKSS